MNIKELHHYAKKRYSNILNVELINKDTIKINSENSSVYLIKINSYKKIEIKTKIRNRIIKLGNRDIDSKEICSKCKFCLICEKRILNGYIESNFSLRLALIQILAFFNYGTECEILNIKSRKEMKNGKN